MKYKIIVLLLGCLFSLEIFSQKKPEIINSHTLLEKGYKYFEKEQYFDALGEYQKVPENDTNYYVSLVEQIICYYRLEKYEEGISAGKKAMKLDLYIGPELFQNMGTCYDMLGKYDESVKCYEIASQLFPKNNFLIFNKGFSYEKLKKYDDAFSCYKKSTELNPFHARTHYALGVMAMNEGNTSLAMIAFATQIMLDPKSQFGNLGLGLLNDISTSKYQEEVEKKNIDITDGEDYSDIDLLLHNYAALNKKYKVPTKVDLNLIKQLYLLLDKIPENPAHKGFWHNLYVPFYKQLLREKKFDIFAIHLLQASGNDSHKEIVNKNAAKLKEFREWLVKTWDNLHRQYEMEFNGRVLKVDVYRAHNRFAISSIEHFESEKPDAIGYIESYHYNGRIKATGKISREGKKQGEWISYHPNGNINEKTSYTNGNLEYYEKYSLPGIKEYYIPYKNEKINGQAIVYTKSGAKLKVMTFKDDVKEGPYEEYYITGQLFKKYSNKGGKIDGQVKGYYITGELAFEEFYVDGKQENDEIYYYQNGNIKSKATYKNDVIQGPYIKYFKNGKVSDSVNFIDGKAIGKSVIYFKSGTIETTYFLDETGKTNGIRTEYDTDGKIYNELEYRKGELISYKFYNKKGEIIKSDKKKSGNFDFQGFYATGIKKSEGKYGVNEWQGEWKFYDEYGNLQKVTSYDDGKAFGTSKIYYPEGTLKSSTDFVKGVEDGYYFENYPDGVLNEHGIMKDGDQVGDWTYYFPNKLISSSYFFVGNELNGLYRNYYIDGKLSEAHEYYMGIKRASFNYDTLGNIIDSIIFTNASGKKVYHYYKGGPVLSEGNLLFGKNHGTFTAYFPNGQIREKGEYVNGDRHGLWNYYYWNGQVRTRGNYEFNDQDGKWEYFSEDGILTDETIYENGLRNGKSIDYYESGKIKREDHYIDDDLEGTSVIYTTEGQVEHKRTFLHGQLISYSYYDASGKEKIIDVENASADIKMYHSNGKLARTYSIKNGLYTGKYYIYYASGEIREETEYKNDYRHGQEITYYPNKQIHTKENYYYGLQHGLFEEYYPNGAIKKKMTYLYDRLHGKCYLYDKNNKLTAIHTYYDGGLIAIQNF